MNKIVQPNTNGGWQQFSVWRVRADGTGLTELVRWPGPTYGPDQRDAVYSPDGSKIAFSSTVTPSGQVVADAYPTTGHSIWETNADGSNPRQITPTPTEKDPKNHVDNMYSDDMAPAYSPDGQRIAYRRVEFDNLAAPFSAQYDVHIVNADGTGNVRLTNSPTNEDTPSWSSDGQKVFFYNNDSNTGFSTVGSVRSDGTGRQTVVNLTGGDSVNDVQTGVVADVFEPWVDPADETQWTVTSSASRVAIDVHDDGAGVQQIQVTAPDDPTWDGGTTLNPSQCSSAGVTCPVDQEVTVQAGNLSQGFHAIRTVVTDSAGNSWTRDLTLAVGAPADTSSDTSHDNNPGGGGAGTPPALTALGSADFCRADSTEPTNQYCNHLGTNKFLQQALAEAPLSGNPTSLMAGDLAYPASAGKARRWTIQYGFSDQLGLAFSLPEFKALKIKRVRIIVPWDIANYGADPANNQFAPVAAKGAGAGLIKRWTQMTHWLRAAKNAGFSDLLVSFAPDPDSPAQVATATYKTAVTRFQSYLTQNSKKVPWVPYYTAWNEPNLGPYGCCKTASNGGKAAALYNALFGVCDSASKGCAVLPGDFSDSPAYLSQAWMKSYTDAVRHNPKIWALHPYYDGHGRSPVILDKLLGMIRPGAQIWFTEVNGIIHNATSINGQKISSTATQAASDLAWLLQNETREPQVSNINRTAHVTRFYAYSWAGDPPPKWDSGITVGSNPTLRRPAYCELQKVTNPSVGASCTPDTTQ